MILIIIICTCVYTNDNINGHIVLYKYKCAQTKYVFMETLYLHSVLLELI